MGKVFVFLLTVVIVAVISAIAGACISLLLMSGVVTVGTVFEVSPPYRLIALALAAVFFLVSFVSLNRWLIQKGYFKSKAKIDTKASI